MSDTISILIVDNHEIVRNGVRSFLETQPDFRVVGESESGEDAIDKASLLIPDIVLVDMNMPGMDGIELTRCIKSISPDIQIVVLTGIFGDGYGLSALKAGVISFLLKDIRMEKLADALRAAFRGEPTLHPRIITRLLQYVRAEKEDDFSYLTVLSKRELDVLKFIAGGMTNKDIASELQISENTVKGHVSSIRAKLKIADRVRLAIYAWERGIVKKQEPKGDPRRSKKIIEQFTSIHV